MDRLEAKPGRGAPWLMAAAKSKAVQPL
eukprot:COSAG02_NODE_67163_length_253_cov_1.324675_1_plen_27_part_10